MKRGSALAWRLKTTWSISKSSILLWASISALLAVLPAIALRFNRETLSVLSGFLAGTGDYTYADAVSPILALGALMTPIGLSARINLDLLYFVMYDAYFTGMFALNFAFTKKTRRQRDVEYWDSRRIEYYEGISENPGMAKEVRVYENTDEFTMQWSSVYNRSFDSQVKRAQAEGKRDFISGAGFYIFLIINVGVSILGVSSGTIRPDVFLVMFTLCLNIYTAINGLGGLVYRFDSGLYALGRQGAFFQRVPMVDPDNEKDKRDAPANEELVFKTDNLCFSYASDIQVLSDVNLTVRRGEIVALVGENGSGKSTLIKLLLNMYRPTAGSVEFFGRPFNEYKHEFVRGKIGVFFQDFWLFHQTLRENVGFGGIEDIGNEPRIWDALRKGGGEKLAKQLPKRLDTLLNKNMDKSGTELSGGEKQRVGVSRAHMSDRDVLIFDEPASMLDPIAEMEQFMNIKNMLDGRTAILISHRVGFARMADRVVMLHNGEIAEMGTHDELMELDGLYASFFNEQAQWYETTGILADGEVDG